MADNFLGEIRMFGGNYAPANWALCNGQLLNIAQASALFSLIGTTYGGNGQTTFALPNLQGRIPISMGQGPGLSNRPIGQSSGTENVTLTANEVPIHSHTFSATADPATIANVGPTVLPAQPTVTGAKLYAVAGGKPNTPEALAPTVVGFSGGSQAHSNLMPTLCVTFIIALTGIFPSRN